MHQQCQCCSSCQDELQSLRHRFQSLLIDYTCLRDRSHRQYTTNQICLNENMHLNRKMIEQKVEIRRLQSLLQNNKISSLAEVIQKSGREAENEEQRKEISRIDSQNKVIDSKNRELSQLKYQLHLKKTQIIQKDVQIETLRRKHEELNESNRNNLKKIDGSVNKVTDQKQSSLISPLQSIQTYENLKQDKNKLSSNQWHSNPISPLNISFPSNKGKEKILPNYLLKPDQDKSTTVHTKSIQSSVQSQIDKLQHQNDLLRNQLSMRI